MAEGNKPSASRRREYDLLETGKETRSEESCQAAAAKPVKRRRKSRANEIAVNRAERFNDVWKAVVERFLVARKQRDLGTALHRDAAVAIELNLKRPVLLLRQRGHGWPSAAAQMMLSQVRR